MHPDPLQQFGDWYAEAVREHVPMPDAMTLATATPSGRPSARVVLYKGHDEGGLRFYTSYESRKGRELAANPHAALVFYWDALKRQVRFEGTVERLDAAASDAYFASRPKGSRMAAAASPQSQEVATREELVRRFTAIEFGPGPSVARPGFWGGYRLVPVRIEFWIGREHRLHDRYLYRRRGTRWERVRLAP